MKHFHRLLIIVCAFILSSTESKATHLMGGEITAIQLHDSTYLITLTTYRDTLGIPMDSIANFVVKDTAGNTVMTFQIPYDTAISGGTLRLYPYGVEVYIFRDTIQLPGPGKYHIGFTDCCRNGAIQNLSNPLSNNMYLTTTVTHFDSTNNSTPFFLVQPVIFLPRNTSWGYNPLPFDLDGDSLVWSLDTPLTAFNTPCGGYTAPPSTSTGPFTLNSANGSITWTASTLGNFNATVLVEEYRNGVKIGEIRRDMQFIVVAPSGSMARMTNMDELDDDPAGNPHEYLNANSQYMFSFYAEDPDTGDVVSMHAYGEPIMNSMTSPAAFFVRKTGKTYGNEIEGTFIWKPTMDEKRQKPYLVVYRVSDGFHTIDYTVMYTVLGPQGTQPDPSTGIDEEKSSNLLNVYPNPAQNVINLELKLKENDNVSYRVYDITGQIQFSSPVRNLDTGNHVISQQVSLAPGTYILELTSFKGMNERMKIVISE